MSESLELLLMTNGRRGIPNGKKKVVDYILENVLWEDPEVQRYIFGKGESVTNGVREKNKRRKKVRQTPRWALGVPFLDQRNG
jgi:hypothetical protein